ncbi:MAG: sigma-70 RNA polymerase sigma factor region 4 domain-containing protein [Planctomycetota bacterium]
MKISKANLSETGLKAQDESRDRIDLIRQRLSLLSGEDKLLMTMYWENGNSLQQISKLAGLNRRSIARRIHKITERLIEGQFIDCMRYRNKFTHSEMTIAKDYFLLGFSMKKIAETRHLSFYNVRKSLEKIRKFLATVGAGPSECKLTD